MKKIFPKFSYISAFFILLPILVHSEDKISSQNEFPNKDSVVLTTGREKGTYFAVGNTIKEIIENDNLQIQIHCKASKGSVDNAWLIESGKTDLAIIQSDYAYYLYRGIKISSSPSNKIKGICPLYIEAVQIVTKEDSGIKSIKDLKGKIVSVGQIKSGSESNAWSILHTLDIIPSDFTPEYKALDQSIRLLKSDKINAFFITTKIGDSSLIQAFEDSNLRLISFNPEEIKKIRKYYPFFYSKIIKTYFYRNQKKEIQTLGVRALLVAHSFTEEEKVYQITKSLFNNKEKLKKEHPFILLNAKEAANPKFMRIPLHPGAKEYYSEIGIGKHSIFFYPIIVILICLVAFIVIILIKEFPDKATLLFNKISFFSKNLKLAVIFVIFYIAFIFLFSCVMHFYESSHSLEGEGYFDSIPESFWSCIVYLFSGYEDRAPESTGGKFISVFIFILGVSIFGIISGRIASFFVEKALKKEKKMPRNIKNHVVICNWNNRGEHIIDELYNAGPNLDIIILADIEIKNEKNLLSRIKYKRVHFVHEDPALHGRLEASRIHQAKSVIILSNERCQDPDAQSALIALAISKVCGTKRPHIIAEILNHRKIHHLKDAGVNETICATDYGIGLMAQSALHPRLRLTKVYDNLLSYSKETNEFYLIKKEDIPSLLKTTKTTFSKISEILNKKRNSENPVLLVGVMREGEPVINPIKGQDEIRENDDLVVLAYNPPDLSDME